MAGAIPNYMQTRSTSVLADRVSVAVPGSAAYDVIIGADLLRELPRLIEDATGGRRWRPFVVTSPNIWELWSHDFLAAFPSEQLPTILFLPAGEAHKRFAAVETLAEQLAEAGADRDALLIAFGGGVIGDITGFLAAIYMRGVAYLQVPTTLLAQVDSSVGGKTGVNLAAGKNLVGSFYHPAAVLADTGLLHTLPPRELRAGLQESVKAAIIRSEDLFAYLEQGAEAILAGEPDALTHVVRTSVEIKAEVVIADEREAGRRMILNFGHTLGHAIEAATGYRELLHGEAVAWGSIAALHLGRMRGSLAPADFDRMRSLILRFGPLPCPNVSAARLVELSASDKKNRGGRRAFVLPKAIGSVEVVHDVDDAELLRAAEAMLEDASAHGAAMFAHGAAL